MIAKFNNSLASYGFGKRERLLVPFLILASAFRHQIEIEIFIAPLAGDVDVKIERDLA